MCCTQRCIVSKTFGRNRVHIIVYKYVYVYVYVYTLVIIKLNNQNSKYFLFALNTKQFGSNIETKNTEFKANLTKNKKKLISINKVQLVPFLG